MAVDPEAADNKRRAIAALITKLWSHYWVPEMPRTLAAELMIDWLHDLENYDLDAVEEACNGWRRSPKGSFPKPGQLLQIVVEEQRRLRSRRAEESGRLHRETVIVSGGTAKPPHPIFDSRPLMWWGLPQALWKPHWRDEEIPDEWRAVVAQRRLNAEATQ